MILLNCGTDFKGIRTGEAGAEGYLGAVNRIRKEFTLIGMKYVGNPPPPSRCVAVDPVGKFANG